MNSIWKFAIFLACFSLFSCAEKSKNSGGIVDSSQEITSKSVQEKSKHLAYIHELQVNLDSALVAQTHSIIISRCNADIKYKCVVLNASLNTGDFSSSGISIRVMPEGIALFSKLASQGGYVSKSSSKAEDLGDKIVDSQKRIEMLEAYRAKLEILESKPNDDIDALVKIASELSKIQNEIEYAKGKSASLLQRVEMDVLNISLYSHGHETFFGPISDAISEFGNEFSYGISNVISAAAYLIPWLVFVILLFFVLRSLYRLFRKKN